FILGVLPLAISTGAGSGSQRAIGTGVIGGMVAATVLGIYFVPVFFVIVYKFAARSKKPPLNQAAAAAGPDQIPPEPASPESATHTDEATTATDSSSEVK
ncbi:MAG: efflux RND transporter permease subunit, partial [Bacteroidales bacterium]